MLLQLNSRPDATPSNHYHPAYGRPSAAQGQSTSRIDTVVGLYVLLGSFDEAATVSPSYREQLVNTVTSSALQSTRLAPRDAATAAISLKPKLNAAGRKHPAYRKLLQVGLAALRTATAAPATPLKDWKITPSLGCNCHVCQRAVAILTNPLLDNGSITGRDAIFGSHLSGVLERAAKKPNSGFTFRQVSSRAARQNGHVQITKDPAGRTPVAQLRGMEQQRIQREALLPTLRQLEEIEDDVTAPNKTQPVADVHAYEALLAALQSGHTDADALVKKLAAEAASPAALAAALDDPAGAALRSATCAPKAARDQAAPGTEVPASGAGLIRWVGSFFPEEQRAAVEAAVEEEDVAELEVRRHVDHRLLCRWRGTARSSVARLLSSPQSSPTLSHPGPACYHPISPLLSTACRCCSR